MTAATRHVVITGGSSGIGAAIARIYAEQGFNVSLIARSHAALETQANALREEFAQPHQLFHSEAADVCDAQALSASISRCEDVLGPCDVLVVSAAMVEPGRFETQSPDQFTAQITTNLIGAANTVRAVYPTMRKRRTGRILLIGSGASLTGIYGYSAYCASKFGLLGFAEALRQEAKEAGVSVSICFPPDTETPQLAAELALRPAKAWWTIGRAAPMTAQAVAIAAVKGTQKGRFTIYPSRTIALFAHTHPIVAPLLRLWFDARTARMRRDAKRMS